MDPVRNPYAPGAGQRPPELAGRDSELETFEVMLTRVGRGRPERSIVLTGLRGVGKTVLLNTLRSQAVRRGWGTGKVGSLAGFASALGHAAVVSGAGPTVLVLTTGDLEEVVVAEVRSWGKGWRVLRPGVPDVGLQVVPGAAEGTDGAGW